LPVARAGLALRSRPAVCAPAPLTSGASVCARPGLASSRSSVVGFDPGEEAERRPLTPPVACGEALVLEGTATTDEAGPPLGTTPPAVAAPPEEVVTLVVEPPLGLLVPASVEP